MYIKAKRDTKAATYTENDYTERDIKKGEEFIAHAATVNEKDKPLILYFMIDGVEYRGRAKDFDTEETLIDL